MSANESINKICKVSNDQQIMSNTEEKLSLSIVKYEDKQKVRIRDECTLLNNLKNTTLRNERKDKICLNFCELDIMNNFGRVLPQNKSSEICRKLKSESSVGSSCRRKKHKHIINRSGSQIDTQFKNSSNTSSLEQKASRKSRSLSRNKNPNENISDTKQEDVFNWKQEIEALEIKRQDFVTVGENKPIDIKSSKDREKSSSKQYKNKCETSDFNLGDYASPKKIFLMNDDGFTVKDNFPKKEFDQLDKEMKRSKAAHRSSKKKRNNSPNLPFVQHDLETDTNLKENSKSPIPDVLLNLKNSGLKEKYLKIDDNVKDKTIRSHAKNKCPKDNAVVNIENISDKRNENTREKDHNETSKEIIDVFKNICCDRKGSNDNSQVIKNKHKRKHKEHKSKTDNEKMCPRHSKLRQTIDNKSEKDEAITKVNTSKMLLLFGLDYLMNSEALKADNEPLKTESKEMLNPIISNDKHEDVNINDRKEISFSNLNLSPIIDHYATNKSLIDSIFDKAKKKRHTHNYKDVKIGLSDEFSLISEPTTPKERSIRRQRQDRAKHFFGSQAKTTRLINQTTNHLVSDENLIEVSTKMLANDLIKSSVEGIEPPRKLAMKAFHKKSKSIGLKNDNLLHMTFLKPISFPDVLEEVPTVDSPSANDHLIDIDKEIVLQNENNESQIKSNSLKPRTSTDRKSKISVLYEHRSNPTRRKELRNKICRQGSKPNIINNKSKSDSKQQVQKICANPDLVQRVSCARNSNKLQTCSKCHGTKKTVLSAHKSKMVSNKKQDVFAAMSDKSISVNISCDTNTNHPEKKLAKKSFKKMCTVDTQTDLMAYKIFVDTEDDECQTAKVRNVNKLCSPIVIAVPGIHKSDTNVVKDADKQEKSKDIKFSAYQKLQSAVLSIFESTKMSGDEEIAKTNTDVNGTSNHLAKFATDDKKIKKNTRNVEPTSSTKPVLIKRLPTKPVPSIKLNVYSARTRLANRSAIPKLLRKSQEDGRDEPRAKDKKSTECNAVTPLVDLQSLQGCIEDLISVLNDMRIKQPAIEQTNHGIKNKGVKSTNRRKDAPNDVKSTTSIESTKKQKIPRHKRPTKLCKHYSSASFDSNRNASEVYLTYETKSKQMKKSNRKRVRKSAYNEIGEEKKLRNVFKNRNYYGSSPYTQVSSSGSEFANAMTDKDLSNLKIPNVCGSYFLNPENNDFNNNRSFGVDKNVFMEQPANVQNDLPSVCSDLLRKSINANEETSVQKPQVDYKNIMEQLVYMFSQKPVSTNEELSPKKASPTTSSDFSADSLEPSWKYEVPKEIIPPKNCDFFVYATTIELDDKDMNKDLTRKNEEDDTVKTFTSFKDPNTLKSTSTINTMSSNNVVQHDNGFVASDKKSASLKNFFKKGGSLLDLFKHKHTTNSMDGSSRKPETMPDESRCENITESSKQHNEVIVGFSPGQYLFSLCPQKKSSLQTVHEGVQASPTTTETSTMRKWTDLASNQTNRDTSTESNPKPTDRKVDSMHIKPCLNCPVKESSLTEAENNGKPCKCKTEPKAMDPTSMEVANCILNTLLDNVMAAMEHKIEIREEIVKFKRESFVKPDSSIKVNRDGVIDNKSAEKKDLRDFEDSSVFSISGDLVEEFQDAAILTQPSKDRIDTEKEIFEKLLNAKEPPTLEEIDRLLAADVQTLDPLANGQGSNKKYKKKSVELSEIGPFKKPTSIEDIDHLLLSDVKTLDGVEDAQDIRRRSKTKSKSMEQTTDAEVKQSINVDSSISNKEVFEKILDIYEKEDGVAERLSMDDQFFENELDIIRSSSKTKAPSPVTSDEYIPEKPVSTSILIANDNEAAPDKKKSNKKNKLQRMFSRHKENVKQLMVPSDEDTTIKQRKDSIKQVISSHSYRQIDSPHQGMSKTKDMRFEQDEYKRPFAFKKKADCAEVEADDIGTCFARGFRPDNLSLSGDACFNLNKQDKYAMSPNMTSSDVSIIDFSERQTPLDYLLALGFMVDEASNALKDEDIRSRLLAAITEARVWINKITTTQGTLLYLVAYKIHPKTMRYFLQLVEAIINNRINNAIKLNGFLKVLERVEDGELQMVDLLGADKFEDEEDEEKIVKKQLRQLFATVYKIAEKEARLTHKTLDKASLILLRMLAAKYRTGLHPHLELIASYIGQNLIKNEIQLEAAMIYLSRLDTTHVKLKEFEAYCAIRCDEENDKT